MKHPPCIICGGDKQIYLYTIHKNRLWQCTECGIVSSYPHLTREDILMSYGNDADPEDIWLESPTEIEASKDYIKSLLKRIGGRSKIILVAPSQHIFADLAPKNGIDIVRHLTIHEFENISCQNKNIDAIVFLYQIEKFEFPQKIFEHAYEIVKSEGFLFIVTPSLDSRSARFFGPNWTEWRPENKYYFDFASIQSILLRNGFNNIQISEDARWYTFEHINQRATNFPNTRITRSIRLIYKILPSRTHSWRFRLPSSGMVVCAQKTQKRKKNLLSIIVPVYNESATFPTLMGQLVSKQFEGVDKEIVLVESNSSDDSRELVLQYEGQSGIKVILQEKALGKGNAVRDGFSNASGDVLLIQDADLEYDLDDYESLLEPILSYKEAFVLGSRHGGNWKMRHFNDQYQLAAIFNFGHVLFTFLINLLYGQRLKDPFTMFKVFRRDCLYNLKLECDRFDFDFELVIKLIRKGYTPVEIPVNYNSRSFAEGKKVNMFRDPLTWIRALIKYRFVKITND